MTPVIWALFGVTVCLDVWGQTAFKLGLRRIEAAGAGGKFWLDVATSPLIVVGVLSYAIEAVCWMYVIGHAPLSVVGPMAALAYVGAVISGKLFLGEQANRRRWVGAGLVTVGAALLGASLG